MSLLRWLIADSISACVENDPDARTIYACALNCKYLPPQSENFKVNASITLMEALCCKERKLMAGLPAIQQDERRGALGVNAELSQLR